MPFESSVFQREVTTIVETGAKNVFFEYEAILHADGKSIKVYYVDLVETQRDYLTNVFEIKSIEVNLGPGTYEKYIVPFKDNLELTLIKKPLGEVANNKRPDEAVESYRYRASLYDGKSEVVGGKNPAMQDINAADNSTMKTVRLQLTDKVVEQVRLKTIGTNFRNTTAINALKVVLGRAGKTIKNSDDSVAIRGVDVAPNFNDQVREHVVIPQPTKLVNLPEYMHLHCGGLYSGGLGYFLQDGIWYIYPPYDITRYPKTAKTLTILNVPAERYPNPERSFRQTPNQLIILATGEVKHVDESESMAHNLGNGVRFADANRLFTDFAVTGGNKAVAARGLNTSEFISEERNTGINNAQVSDRKITSNYPYERSKLASRVGSFIQLVWESSLPSLIYPGMPTKLMYLENGRAQELFGTLVSAHSFDAPVNMGVKERKFSTKTALALFVDKKLNFSDPEYQQ